MLVLYCLVLQGTSLKFFVPTLGLFSGVVLISYCPRGRPPFFSAEIWPFIKGDFEFLGDGGEGGLKLIYSVHLYPVSIGERK